MPLGYASGMGMRDFISKLRGFRTDQSGQIALTFVLAMLPIAVFTLYAVDMGRIQGQKSQLQALTDGAALQAARHDTERDAREAAERFLKATADAKDLTLKRVNVDVVTTKRSRTIRVEAAYELDRMTPLTGQEPTLDVVTNSTAHEPIKDLEIALVLDVSSSMSGPKFTDLQNSTKAFIDRLYEGPAAPFTSVSLIPYGGTVNVRPLYRQFADYLPIWNGCWDIPADVHIKEVMPDDQLITTPTFWKWEKRNPWCPQRDTAVLMNSKSRAALKNAVSRWKLSDGTGMDIGVSWGMRALSPEWRGKVGGDFAKRPAAWDEPGSQKMLILMSDGEITAQFRPENPERGYVQSKSPDETELYSKREAEDAFLETCRRLRANDVDIFTIAYRIEEEAPKKLMQNCSGRARFFDADEEGLEAIYGDILQRMSPVRLVE